MSQLYQYQERVRELMLSGRSIILQAPTGAGKTRAALTPFLDPFWDTPPATFPKKCTYAVPMRVLANQFTEEIRSKAASYGRVHKRELHVGRQTGEYREDPEFLADLTFATIDQVLSNWLLRPYSQSKRKWNLNAGAFVGSYLIFDEFHLFDPDSTLPSTLHMLKTLNGVSPFMLMTATFSGEMLRELAAELNAEPVLLTEASLADIPSQNKRRIFQTVDRCLVDDGGAFVEQIVAAHLAQNGRQRSLVVCNQVERAQRVYLALRQHPDLANVEIRLLHSRFLQEDRQQIEEEIRREFHKDAEKHTFDSLILVGTQVVEVGLDISSRALHTELAPGAAVLQRAGRCARYAGEEGHVYVYPVEKLAPYNGGEAKQQCERTWEWLQEHNGQHLDFEQEQALINRAHTPSDRRILDGLRGTEWDLREKIHALWRGEGSRAEAVPLIRDIQAVSVAVHSQPDQLSHAPFAIDTFSLHPGTLQGKFKAWQEENELKDPDWDDGRLPWIAQKLVEVEDEEDAQGNRPIRYEFKPVGCSSELFATLVVLHPALVGYSQELGLTLHPSEMYECEIPSLAIVQERPWSGYRLESYKEHIKLVHGAFSQPWHDWVKAVGYDSWLGWVTAVGRRLEQQFGWQSGIVTDMAQLVICLHDTGKLSTGWQGWARRWQAAIGSPIPPGATAAHTDYDPGNEAHQQLDRKLRRQRPNHAVEGAYAAMPLLMSLLPDKTTHRPLVRAAFSAISRHHGPFSSQPGSFELVEDCAKHVGETAVTLPTTLQTKFDPTQMKTQLDYTFKVQRGIDQAFLVQPDNPADMLCYMVLVRALRFADQEGTKQGSMCTL